ncbi:beta-galactosidase trimerization domain-containing protein [Bauldia sp.]|uniref:beta-galactosidase trimerization domain-containing protein n=1 Tax=Bauldia sp. TaxID=2575872 RepID=UPI003BAAACEF
MDIPVSTDDRRLRAADWYKTATRWTQLTLAEDDPVKFDPDFWIDIFKRTRSNATCLSAGGYIAYYPSKVPLHYVSKYLGDSDPFGDLVAGARDLGMHVMARVDPHAIHQDAADAHPEWVACDASGAPRRHWAYPDVWVTCAYGDYNAKFMPQVVAEIAANYDIDAVFANRWQGHGICYCETCKSRFGAFSGKELPRTTDPDDPVWQSWVAWRRQVLSQIIVDWDEVAKAARPHVRFIPNMSGASLMEFDLDIIEAYCPFLVVDHQGRRGTEPVWTSGRNGKRMRASFPDRPVVQIASIGPEDVHRWKDAVTTGPEIQSWIANGTTHGLRPWFTKFNGVVPDTRWVEPVIDVFAIDEAIEPVCSAMTPTADIAVVDPATTLRHQARETLRAAEHHDLGFYHALVEARLPFEMISDTTLDPARLDAFKVLVIPNAPCLSDAQCQALRAYVERGGSMVAAYETSASDENGEPRAELGLADVFGVTRQGRTREGLRNTYIALGGAHPVNEGFGDARRIMGGTATLDVVAAPGTISPFLTIPDFPDLPMEEVYPREEPHAPAVVARETPQGGRVVYVPFNIGAVFWDVLTADHGRLIGNAVRWALGEEPRVVVDGGGVLDIAVRKSADGLAVSLFNLTNPMMMKGPVRSLYPSGPQRVRIRLPEGRRVAQARLLVADSTRPVVVDDAYAIVDVPSFELLEVVHFAWA